MICKICGHRLDDSEGHAIIEISTHGIDAETNEILVGQCCYWHAVDGYMLGGETTDESADAATPGIAD